jgi:uncharacterized protein YkwD
MKTLRALALSAALLAFTATSIFAAGVTPAQEQTRARDEVNRIRTRVGVAAAASSSALNAAATTHAKYMVSANEYGHFETIRSDPYYRGYGPVDRGLYYGYSNSSVDENWKSDSLGSGGVRTPLTVDNAVQWWMSAIYHRFSIVSPQTEHVGYTANYVPGKSVSVLEMGKDYGAAGPVTRWPVPNQTGVGTRLDYESPNPVAQFGGSFPTGYPVSMTWYRYGRSLRYTAMTMVRSSDGAPVDGFRMTPDNDTTKLSYYSTSLTFIPKAPLAYDTQYTVRFAGTFDGAPFDHTWSFRTMIAPGWRTASAPANGATAVSRTPPLSLGFNRLMRTYTFVASPLSNGLQANGVGISLTREADGAEIPLSVSRPTATTARTVSFRPTTTLAATTRYRITYTLADQYGRPYRGVVTFTTGG